MPLRQPGWKERSKRLALVCGFVFCPLAQAFDHAHRTWDALVQRHVVLIDGGKASQLRYAGMAAERAALKGYLETLSAVAETEFERWSREEQMAFLINAYNAFTVEKILTRYPRIGSIWDFGRLIGNPFKDEFFVLLGGKKSLDWVEHQSLRKRYRDPRIHYAVNCASIGCPMLREEAFVAARLEAQLEQPGEVRGRVERVGLTALIHMVAHKRGNARIMVRDAWNLFEIDMRNGHMVDLTRTAVDGSFARGPSALPQLIGVTSARFSQT
jgi:hypothetical protein